MKPYDIYNKPPKVYRRIAVRRDNRWVFTSIPSNSFARQTKTQRFYLMNEVFSLCQFNQRDPDRGTFYGKPGDYIAADENANLTLVTAKEYNRKYEPTFRTGSSAPLNSDDFSREGRKTVDQFVSNSSTTNSTSTGGSANARSGNTRTSY